MFVVCRSATQPGIAQDLTSPLASTLSAQLDKVNLPSPPHTPGPQFSMRLLTSNSTGNRKEVRRKMRRGIQAEPHLCTAHSASPSHCRFGKNLLLTRLSMAGASPQAPHWAFQLLHNPQALSETRSEFSGLSPVPSQLMPSWPTGGQSLHPISHSHGLAAPLAPPAPLHLVFTLLQSCPTNNPHLSLSTTASGILFPLFNSLGVAGKEWGDLIVPGLHCFLGLWTRASCLTSETRFFRCTTGLTASLKAHIQIFIECLFYTGKIINGSDYHFLSLYHLFIFYCGKIYTT